MRRLLPTLILSLLTLTARADAFSFADTSNDHLDVLLDGKVVARYMYAHDTSTKERRTETYKPYLHVFDAQGKALITQGAGGKQFPHHRGIYIGWQKLGFEGKKYNFWEMAAGDIVHEKFTNQQAGADSATFTSHTRWIPNGTDKPVIEEDRTITVRKAPAPARLLIDFTSTLKAPIGDVTLDADPEHGGIQYRPAGDIKANQTTYLFPTENADAKKETDYPWVGLTYTLPSGRYSVVDISHPQNPKGTRWSAYRDYGRFGAFPKATLKKDETLTLKYRFIITDGDQLPADQIQKVADDFTGAANTPIPKTTAKPADGAKKPAN